MKYKYIRLIKGLLLSSLFLSIIPSKVFAQTTSTDNLEILAAKVDLLQVINSQTLNSVYWTLGILATIFVALISVNLYFNISGNKREIERIKEDVISTAKSEILSAEANILGKVSALNQKEFANMKIDLMGILKGEILSAEANILGKVSALNQKEFANMKTSLESTLKNEMLTFESKLLEKISALEKTTVNYNTKLESKIENLIYRTDELDVDVKELEVEKYEKKGQQGAIINRIELLKTDINKKNDWRIPARLGEIRDYLKTHTLRPSIASQLEKELSRISSAADYTTLIQEIKSNLKIGEE